MSVYADCKESFRVLARIASKSLADPPWFAVPVNAQEDQDSVTVYFHVPGKRQSQLQVQASDSGEPPHQPNGHRAVGKRV